MLRARCLAVLVFLVAVRLAALDIPPKPTQWVNDYGANLLTASETQQLNEKLEAVQQRTNTQFLIMIWPSLQGDDDLEFTNRVANVWKVKDDKALMLFVFLKERKIRIQVGYGLEAVITDAYSSRVVRETIAPQFRQNQYAAGLSTAIDQLATKIDPSWTSTTTSSTTTPLRQPVQRPVSRSTPGPSGSDIVILIVLFLVFLFVILPLLRRGGCGGCSGCIFPMFWGGGGGTTFG
ncbi:MAG TPA: TPM domain-containing protein, partial [Thermoanaerobaculia bacterium]|nr:TPM domain-containing protein [Thermoanaerobaculia bacterium]